MLFFSFLLMTNISNTFPTPTHQKPSIIQPLASDTIHNLCKFTSLNFLVSIVNQIEKRKQAKTSYCMGSIVSKIWILTSASCVETQSIRTNRTEVSYGDPHPYEKNDKFRIKVESGVRHPFYDPDSIQHSSHNVGLLKLISELDLGPDLNQNFVHFQKGRYFVQRCFMALVPKWRKSAKGPQNTRKHMQSPKGDLECIISEISSSARCDGYDEVTVDIPNSICTMNTNNEMRGAHVGAPMICEGRTRAVIIGVLSLSEDDKSAVYTRLDKYFKFIWNQTGIKVPFLSEPILSAKNCTINVYIYFILLFNLMLY